MDEKIEAGQGHHEPMGKKKLMHQSQFPQARFSIAFRDIIEPCQGAEVARKTSIIRTIKATVAITSIVMPWRLVNPHFIAAV
jgi:hypothetical protein